MPGFCSRTIWRIPIPSRPSGASCSRAATASWSPPIPGLLRLLETLDRGNGHAAHRAARLSEVADSAPAPAAVTGEIDETLLGGVAAAMALVKAHRMHGHLAARLDPLGSEPLGDPALDETRLIPPLTPELQARIPAKLLRVHVPGETLLEALPALREVYCGTIAYEIEHISDHAERVWLRQAIESGRYREPLSVEERVRLLDRVSRAEGFEQYLRRAFLGQKQFSLEGLDTMVPMLDEAIEIAAGAGAHEVVIGMAHRGRLNVLVHTVGRSYESILREFEGERTIDAVVANDEGGTGDVKYHLAAAGTRATASGEVTVTLAPNPSHLEAVDPVVEGWTRAEQTDRSFGAGIHDPSVALPILIHGDASFAGQGVVAETLNLSNLDGYTTGGTLHLIANNQVGFTTDPAEGRSTRYSSDLAKGFDIPIVHVNADDPEAAISAIRLAMAYRQEFGHDIVVDLIGYRRFGHNEQDEAAYTQPLMVAQIAAHPTVHTLYAAQLVEEGVVSAEQAAAVFDEVQAELRAAHDRLKASIAVPRAIKEGKIPADTGEAVVTAVPADRLEQLNEQLLEVPEGFEGNAKLLKQLERRREAFREGGIDWGQGEALALASLLTEGIPVRLTGQDTERGTFSHRHAMLHDQRTGETHAPIQHLPDAAASIELYNSPLSEYACLGFEYGYAVAAPDALVLWEAQFGDFVNGAQIVVDQFLVAGLSKWGQTARLTLLLPHGYEGNGPEHSSAKLERFLQLAAQENIRIANCTTAAQFFHLLRRQALDATARPLVVMTPKGLLRLKQAGSTLADLSEGRFEAVARRPAHRFDRGSDQRDSARPLLREDLLRHRRSRGPGGRDGGGGRAARAALSLPGRAGRGADGLVSEPRKSSSGRRRSRRTWERGGRSATGSRRRHPTASRSGTWAALGARARARATRPRTGWSRTGSCARRWGRRNASSSGACGAPGSRPRPWGHGCGRFCSTCWRCAGGSRRHRW